MAKQTQVHHVQEAIEAGFLTSAEISSVTGICRKSVSNCIWYLMNSGGDVRAALQLKNRLSMRSKEKRVRTLVDQASSETKSIAGTAGHVGVPAIPVVVNIPTDEYGTAWCEPEVSAEDRTVVDFLVKRSKFDDDLNAHLEAIEQRAGRAFIHKYLDQAC